MAEGAKPRPYVSCIKSFGRPILPPLMTDEKRLLMRHFQAVACQREAAHAQRKKEVFFRATDDLSSSESLGAMHSAPSSLATSDDTSPMLSPIVVVTRLEERDEQWAVSDTPEAGSSATLVPSSSSDSETSGTSIVDAVGSQHDNVAGYLKDTNKSFMEKDTVPAIQEAGAEVRETSTETTLATPLTPTLRQDVQSAPTTPSVRRTAPPATKRVTPATTPEEPANSVPATMLVTSPTTPTVMMVTSPKTPVTMEAMGTSVMIPATMPVTSTVITQETSSTAVTTMPMSPETPVMVTTTPMSLETPVMVTMPMSLETRETVTTMPMLPETPAMVTGTTQVTPAKPTTMVTASLSLPGRDVCFPTKVSVPSLCRSRSFVVHSPSLAQLVLKGLHQDGSDCLNGAAVKIVQPCNSHAKAGAHLIPGSSEQYACARRAEERICKTKVLKMSKTFVKADSDMDDLSLSPRLTGDSADESSHRIGDVQLQSYSVPVHSGKEQEAVPSCRSFNFYALEGNSECPKGSPLFAEPTVPELCFGVQQASTLPGKWDCVDGRLISRAFSDTPKSFIKVNYLATQKTGDNSCDVSFDNSSKVTGRIVPWTSSAVDVVAVTKEHVKDDIADNTLHSILNVPDDDSVEETVVDNMLINALDHGCTEFSSSLLPNFFTRDSAATAGTLPMAVVGDWDRGCCNAIVKDWDRDGINFGPLSNSSSRICSSENSIDSLSWAEQSDAAPSLNSSGDVEEREEQYKAADEQCGDQANYFAELAGSVENSGRSLDESSASSGSEQLKSINQPMSAVDMLSAHELKLHALCRTIAQDYAKVDWSTNTALHKEAVSVLMEEGERFGSDDNMPLEVQTAKSTSPACVESLCGHVSPPAEHSILHCSDADHSRVDSSMASVSIHLDLLSETRQSLHPRWRRCFDRLTAMARGHLIRRLMKTHRVQSIIQTIKDTLECALRLHVEPHICKGLVTQQDVELHQRLITQLTSACHELHDVFFSIPLSERMQLISQMRSRHHPVRTAKGCTAPKKISLATQKVLERRFSKLTERGQSLEVEVKKPTAVVRSQTFVAPASADTCHTAGAAASSGTTRKICRLPMYKV